MSSVEHNLGNGISNRRVHLSVEELVEMWSIERPRLQRPVSAIEAIHRPPRPYSESGLYSPQGWILSKAIPFPGELREITQQQADELMAQVLRYPRAMAVLVRHLTNIHPGRGLTRREGFVHVLTKPEYFLGDSVGKLNDLAARIDRLSRIGWDDLYEKLLDLKSQNRISLLGAPLAVQISSPLDLTKITAAAFQTGARYSSIAALGDNPAEFKASYTELGQNEMFVAAGWAALEVFHERDLASQGHQFVYEGLFSEVKVLPKPAEARQTPNTPATPEVVRMIVDENSPAEHPYRDDTRVQIRGRSKRIGRRALLISSLTLTSFGVADIIWGVNVHPSSQRRVASELRVSRIEKRIAINSEELGLTRNPEKIAQLLEERTILLADKDYLVTEYAKVKEATQPQQTEANNRTLAGFGMFITGIAGVITALKSRI